MPMKAAANHKPPPTTLKGSSYGLLANKGGWGDSRAAHHHPKVMSNTRLWRRVGESMIMHAFDTSCAIPQKRFPGEPRQHKVCPHAAKLCTVPRKKEQHLMPLFNHTLSASKLPQNGHEKNALPVLIPGYLAPVRGFRVQTSAMIDSRC